MRLVLLSIIVLVSFSCKSVSEEQQFIDDITGNWLVLYPEDQLKNEDERVVYGKIQDSLVVLKGLKLISFGENRVFRQIDNPSNSGRWDAKGMTDITISEAGEGFENLKTKFISVDKDNLQLAETVKYNEEELRLIWHFKKLDKQHTEKLFSKESNEWRKKPSKPESDAAIKTRLAKALNYYADYYLLIAEESSYFIGKRIILPLEFYQHAIGTKDFDPNSSFAVMFYNIEQAEKAYELLQDVISALRHDFERNNNYVKGYATHMRTMAEKITEMP